MNKRQQGFTLVEIAVVMVIIGLLLGGVLKGQELINSAKVKSVINDFRNTSTHIFAYQDRFRAMPGDDPGVANRLAGAVRASTGGSVGNGRIDGAWNSTTATDETVLVWQHVRLANLATGDGRSPGTDGIVITDWLPRNAAGGRWASPARPPSRAGAAPSSSVRTTSRAASPARSTSPWTTACRPAARSACWPAAPAAAPRSPRPTSPTRGSIRSARLIDGPRGQAKPGLPPEGVQGNSGRPGVSLGRPPEPDKPGLPPEGGQGNLGRPGSPWGNPTPGRPGPAFRGKGKGYRPLKSRVSALASCDGVPSSPGRSRASGA
jgi:prepilin-type N-terminal cleavage/methylation domain-containing protein